MPIFKLLCLVLAVLFLNACSVSQAMRVYDRQMVSVDSMISDVSEARLILVGERHNVPAHHRLQLEVIKGVRETGKEVALGLEMFEGVSQSMLDAWVAGKVSETSLVNLYRWNWRNLPWPLYRDILIYARENKVPVVGLNAPRDLVEKVSRQGIESLTTAELNLLPEGVTAPIMERTYKAIRTTFPVHLANFRYMVEAQVLRNRVMARRIDDYLESHPATVMIVIAGGGHVREKGGIPQELKTQRYKIILPPVPGLTEHEITTGDANYLIEDPFFESF